MAYPGGKGGAGVYQTIINEMPPHDVYIEPFVGGGAVLRHKRPAARSIVVDQLAEVATRWAADGIEAVHGCGIAFLEGYRFTGRELVYADPPYVRSSRRSARALYAHEMTDRDHERLLSVLTGLPCMVMVSGYWSSLYAERLAGWRLIQFEAVTRGGRTATECLWLNFAPAAALHDYRHLGADYRERERITRKVRRWRSKLEGLAPLEQRAIVSALLENLSCARADIVEPGDAGRHRQE